MDEIRELHKYDHAPVGDWHYDMDGRLSPTPSSGASSLSGRLHVNASSSQESALLMSQRWLCQMTNVDGRSISARAESCRSSASPSSSSQIGRCHPRSNSYMSVDDRYRERSASPQPQAYSQRRAKSPAAMRAKAVSRLMEEGSVIMFDRCIWAMLPDLVWNQTFLAESILLFPDTCTSTRLKYWAVSRSSMRNMRHVLNLAIE